MVLEIALVTILANGEVHVKDTFKGESESVRAVYNDCKKQERMLTPCMLVSQRDPHTTVYTNLDSYFQLVVVHQ